MKKTIAIVINTSWNVFNFRLGLLKALQKEGYKIVIIAPRDAYSQKLKSIGFEYHNIIMNNKGTNPFEDSKLIYHLYKLYKKIKPDILLHYTIKPNIYGSFAAGLLGIPVVTNISGLGTVFLNNSLSSKVAHLLYKIALKIPQKVFYQNSHDRELFISSHLVDKNKTDLLPGSGIDTNKFKPNIEQENNTDNFKFLFIARLLKDKGLIEYVEAAKRFADTEKVEFDVLGAFYEANPTAIREGEMNSWVESKIINYLGTTDDVKAAIKKADCIVLPSYREGLSRVLLEAASMAKPIITTDVPGCKEVVDDGVNGYLCKVKDIDSLAKQMKKMILLSDKERKEMGKRGRDKVIDGFDEKIVISKYIDTIKHLIG